MRRFHHQPLPDYSTLLSGRAPRDEIGFPSGTLQIWYNNTGKEWVDGSPHAHLESDECFVVLRGRLIVRVGGEEYVVGPREFCCFPSGMFHSIVEVHPPVEALMIRAPSVEDKVYRQEASP